ncbi:hypothetical protein F5141DRAFT_1066985 [Pisolithus sp. B1]|nr:hypothetical protein F5141DRAFT_1066985 [Pisolithus sp. B1]
MAGWQVGPLQQKGLCLCPQPLSTRSCKPVGPNWISCCSLITLRRTDSKQAITRCFKKGTSMIYRPNYLSNQMAIIKLPKTVMTSGRLKQEYYAASAIMGGLGLVYSAEKGANVVTEVGQLVMDELIETQPEAAQFQRKGFKFWDCMQQFVPPDKARGTNAHHAGMFTKASASVSSRKSMFSQPTIVPPVQHHSSHQLPLAQPHTQYQPWSMQSSVQSSFMQYQIKAPDQSTQNVRCAASSQTPFVMPAHPQALSAMFISSHGKKHKSDATGRLDTASVVTTTSSWKQHTQTSGLEDAVQDFMTMFNESSNRTIDKTLATLDDTSQDQKLSEACMLIYDLEKNLLGDNLVQLQMLFEENPSCITGYQQAIAHSATHRMWWVKLRLEKAGYSCPEYADL